jgi:hypothetical protein
MKIVVQEDLMGCGIACVAYILGIGYQRAKKLFEHPEYAGTIGFYCKDIIDALRRGGVKYEFKKVNKKNMIEVQREGTIVFINKCERYPNGHYVAKSKRGWINSWANYPCIKPARGKIEKNLSGRAEWMIFPV